MIVIKYDAKDQNKKCMHFICSLMDFPYFHGYETVLEVQQKYQILQSFYLER